VRLGVVAVLGAAAFGVIVGYTRAGVFYSAPVIHVLGMPAGTGALAHCDGPVFDCGHLLIAHVFVQSIDGRSFDTVGARDRRGRPRAAFTREAGPCGPASVL
jgi:hypothetical protein